MAFSLDNFKLGNRTYSLNFDWLVNTGTFEINDQILLDQAYVIDNAEPWLPMMIDADYNTGLSGIGAPLNTDRIPLEYYPNVPWRCISKNYTMEPLEPRIWNVTSIYKAEGLSYCNTNTESVRLIAYSYSPENYDFAVNTSYKNVNLGDAVYDDQKTPTKLVANSINDPLVEGLTQIRSLGVLKITMEYDDGILDLTELDNIYNNTINYESTTILGRTIGKYKGLLSIDAVESYNPIGDIKYHRVTYSIKIKSSKDQYDTWNPRELNRGYSFISSASNRPAGKRIIRKSDTNPNIQYNSQDDGDEANPFPLTKLGAIVTDMANTYWLYFQVQPYTAWDLLAIPEVII